MSHNARVRGPSDAWANILPAELTALDGNLAAAVNGADGSAHQPTAPIVISGAGLQVSGLLTVARGGLASVNVAGGIVLADGDVPQYAPGHAGRSRVFVHSLVGGRPRVAGTWRVRHVDVGVQSVAPMMDMSDNNGPQPARWIVPLRMHDGATITQVSVTFRVGWPHTNVPTVMPGARLLRIPLSGGPQILTSAAAGADGSGFVYASKPTSASLWTGQQTLVVPCDQNNVVSIASYTYALEIIEEQGLTGYPWSLVVKQPVRIASAGTSTGFTGTGTIDGVAAAAGDRILVKDNANGTNGIWIIQSGAWTVASDLAAPSDFTQGMIVLVLAGNANAGSYWQAKTTVTSFAGTGAATAAELDFLARGHDDDETPTKANIASAFFAHGNVFQTAAVTYSGITQQTFQ